ncbi:MAG: phosphonate ABC transporter, permease protein PhnE [Thermostichus sp. DG_1_6_bins_120]
MPVLEKNGIKTWQWRDQRQVLTEYALWLLLLLVMLICARFIAERTTWSFVLDAPRQGGEMIARGVPPRWDYMSQLWRPLWDTLTIATLGTALSFIIAVPVAFLAARNTTPHLIVRYLALLIIVGTRSVNSLIWALILVVILGPGVLSGTLAIALRSVGFMGKLIYEGIEEINPEPVEAIRSTGASGAQVLSYAIWPQVITNILGVTIYRWDINLRESTVVGLVGAGGIGIQLDASINTLRWNQVSMILIVIFVSVFISEWISAKARQALI